MSRNASGTYSLPAGNPVVTGTVISSTVQNNTLNDIATALTQSVASTGVTTPTANLPMGGFRHSGVGNATAQACYGSVTDIQNGSLVTLTGVAGADTITATAPFTVAAYAAGQSFRFLSVGANTGAVTINISSLGAKAITKAGAVALNAGDIPSGAVCEITYDGTRFQLLGARQGASVGALTVTARSSNVDFIPGDLGSMNRFTTSFTQLFNAAGTLGSGWYVDVQNIGTGVITFDANGSETFNTQGGARTTIKLYPGEGYRIVCNGASFDLVGRSARVMTYTVTSGGADATIDLEQGFDDTEAASIDVEYSGVTGSSDLQGRVKKSGSYITGASYGYGYVTADGAAGTQNTGSATFFFVNGLSNGALRYGKLSISQPTAAVRQMILADTAQPLTGGTDAFRQMGGLFENTAAAMQGLRFYLASGNIAAGKFSVWINRG